MKLNEYKFAKTLCTCNIYTRAHTHITVFSRNTVQAVAKSTLAHNPKFVDSSMTWENKPLNYYP